MQYVYDDGGRAKAGFKGSVDDCTCRAIAIATGFPYEEVYHGLNAHAKRIESIMRGKIGRAYAMGKGSSARTGVFRPTIRSYMAMLGWKWFPCMGLGTGCKVHLREGELPMGRLVVSCSKHIVAVIDGVIHDTHDPSRGGTRCVYGYWVEES